MLKCIFLRIGLLNDWSHVIGNFIHNVCFSSYVFFGGKITHAPGSMGLCIPYMNACNISLIHFVELSE